ncbi:ribonuclease H-like domain-containing protein [Tanacetum coccineum]
MWKLRIVQYFQVQDYALWEVIEYGNSFKPIARTTANPDGTSTSIISGPVTTEEKAQKKNDVKAKSMLLIALPNEHLLTFNQYKDAKTLFEAIQAKFGGNDATKNTQKTLLKQISLPAEWNTHVVVWRNKPDLDTMSFDDLYNNFKIVEQEVKRTVTTSSISTASTPVSTASTHTTNLSDPTVYAFLANQPNGPHLVHEDLEQIHDYDLEEMDLKWQLALLSMRAKRYYQRTGKKITINGSDTAGYDKSKVECFNCHKMGHFARECRETSKAMVAIDGVGFDWSFMTDEEVPTNMALMAFSDSEINKSEFDLATYKRGLASVEEQLVFYKKNKIENLKKEKESNHIKIDNFKNASKSLDKLIGTQISDNSRKGVGFASYNAIAPPFTGLFAPPTIDLSNSAVLTKSGIVPISAARQNSSRAAAPVSAVRPINTAAPKPFVNSVNTAKGNKVTSAVGKQVINDVKSSACWVWRPKIKGDPQDALKDTGIFDNGCFRHIIGNKSYRTDYQEYDEGFVAFAGSSKGGLELKGYFIDNGYADLVRMLFVDQHNMVACLERTEENTEFHQIVDFLSTCLINYALTVSPTIYASYIEQFWNTATSKTVNTIKQIHAIVDGKAVVISKSSVRSDLLFDDEDGITCLTNDEIIENLALMGYEQLSTKLTFQKALEGEGSTIPPEPQPTPSTSQPNVLEPQTASIQTETPLTAVPQTEAHQNAVSQIVFHDAQLERTKKDTELPQTSVPLDHGADEVVHKEWGDSVERAITTYASLVAAQDSDNITKTQTTAMPNIDIPKGIDTGGSPRRQETIGGTPAQTRSERVLEQPNEPPLSEGHTTGSGEGSMEHTFELTDNIPPTPYDSPLTGGYIPGSDEGRLKLDELITLCIKLSKQMLDLEKEKNAQAVEILKLKKRVDSSDDDLDVEDASKQGRKSDKIKSMFKERDFDDIADNMENVKGEIVDAATTGVSTVSASVTTAGVTISTAEPRTPPTTTTVFDDEDVTMAMAQTLLKMQEEKAKEKGVVLKDVEEASRPVRSITTLQPLPTIDPKDKGKGVLVEEEPEKTIMIKRRDQGLAQIEINAELAQRLHEEELVELDRA